ncbi:DNA-binding CsgD family transcriptional regulator [Nakamurella sp. UYEF19]|uniref:hypothetical protein n=1 Tax=Nakamurella sp. UYEF19 TaxID=1756392 RepID=UPI0033972FB8
MTKRQSHQQGPDPLTRLAELAAEHGPRVGMERVEDPAEIARRLDLAGPSRELLSIVPSADIPLAAMMSSWDADMAILASGVLTRAMYHTEAARRPEILGYLAALAAEGMAVRVRPLLPSRTVVIDRALVVVAAEPGAAGGAALFITEPVMVETFVAQFAALWKSGRAIGDARSDSLSEEVIRETLAMLTSGVTDATAAHQLGVSLRTVRRRVAAVLELLNASSRFEAGVKAAEAGWL